MKKLLLILFLLIILGGVAFYFGWVQFKVPPGHYGVMITKTGGVESDVIKPGDFVWRWEALLPTNLELRVFSPDSVTKNISLAGELPAGPTYADFYETDADFTYALDVTLSFTCKPDQLPQLVEERDLQPDELEPFYTQVSEHAASLASTFFREKAGNSGFISSLNFDFTAFEENLLRRLRSRYPEIDFIQVRVKSIKLPDIELYMTARENYFDIIDIRHSIFTERTRQTTEREIEEIERLEILREYGKLLSEYPILLKYLALQSDALDIPIEEIVSSDEAQQDG